MDSEGKDLRKEGFLMKKKTFVTWWDSWSFPVQSQELDLTILAGPFQLRILHGAMILLRLPPDNKHLAVTVQSTWLLLRVRADLK